MKIVLIGTLGSRRTEYFLKAAQELGVKVSFLDWRRLPADKELEGSIIKLDPMPFKDSDIMALDQLISQYRSQLARLSLVTGVKFLNEPESIWAVLNKASCKKRLEEHHVAATKMLSEKIGSLKELQEKMEDRRMTGVFVKPVFGSGAAGVVAYQRRKDRTGGFLQLAYTSAFLENGSLTNTKQLRRLEDRKEIEEILRQVIAGGAMAEQWAPKAEYQGMKYDLRAVWQFGEIQFLVARRSKGPITILQLNNCALKVKELGLSEETMESIRQVCSQAMRLYPGLSMAGIDILLDKQGRNPKVIEMNGQGDLIYQDIFNENRIYKQQIKWMAGQKM